MSAQPSGISSEIKFTGRIADLESAIKVDTSKGRIRITLECDISHVDSISQLIKNRTSDFTIHLDPLPTLPKSLRSRNLKGQPD